MLWSTLFKFDVTTSSLFSCEIYGSYERTLMFLMLDGQYTDAKLFNRPHFTQKYVLMLCCFIVSDERNFLLDAVTWACKNYWNNRLLNWWQKLSNFEECDSIQGIDFQYQQLNMQHATSFSHKARTIGALKMCQKKHWGR